MLENKEQEKIAGIISDFFDGAVNEADIDILAMKIYEKDVAKLEQDLEFTTKTANELIEIKHKLEQELAELKEKDNYHLRYELAGADETITNLKEQLAEKDIRIEELEGQFAYECECNKQLVELQKQLAEKDKEIEKLKQQYTILENENGKLTTELIMDKYKKAQKEVSFGKQLAMQELEKVHAVLVSKAREVVGTGVVAVRLYTINEVIDQQIKELKGERNERKN